MTNKHDPCEPGRQGISVVVKNGDVDKAIKLFKKKVLSEGLMKELKAREAYEKPSVKKRRKLAEAKRRQKKDLFLRLKNEGY